MTKKKLSLSMFIGVEGNDIISFGSGQPDLPPPKEVYKILPDYSDFKYGLIQGQIRPIIIMMIIALKEFLKKGMVKRIANLLLINLLVGLSLERKMAVFLRHHLSENFLKQMMMKMRMRITLNHG